jgi:hypothetical protein
MLYQRESISMSESKWSLPILMQGLHDRVTNDLKTARAAIGHPGAKGDGSEKVWQKLFKTYLPMRYAVDKATIMDSSGAFSQEIDVVLYDRQYSFLIFELEGVKVIPVEAVYAVFESKQEINADHIEYAQVKAASVRVLHRTSAEVMTIDGPKTAVPQPILAGFLAFENGWKSDPRTFLAKALSKNQADGRLDMGCIAAYGTFGCEGADCQTSIQHDKSVTSFLLDLITKLQRIGTAPAIDMAAYSRWLQDDAPTQ